MNYKEVLDKLEKFIASTRLLETATFLIKNGNDISLFMY